MDDWLLEECKKNIEIDAFKNEKGLWMVRVHTRN